MRVKLFIKQYIKLKDNKKKKKEKKLYKVPQTHIGRSYSAFCRIVDECESTTAMRSQKSQRVRETRVGFSCIRKKMELEMDEDEEEEELLDVERSHDGFWEFTSSVTPIFT